MINRGGTMDKSIYIKTDDENKKMSKYIYAASLLDEPWLESCMEDSEAKDSNSSLVTEIENAFNTFNSFGNELNDVCKFINQIYKDEQNNKNSNQSYSANFEVLVSVINRLRVYFEETKNQLSELGLDIVNIKEINNLIKHIADQIDVLALNVAIEASRLGKDGAEISKAACKIKKLAMTAEMLESMTKQILIKHNIIFDDNNLDF